jgi:hypothetical protein
MITAALLQKPFLRATGGQKKKARMPSRWRRSATKRRSRICIGCEHCACNGTSKNRQYGALGKALESPHCVCFTPKSGHQLNALRCLLCANSGLMHCSNSDHYYLPNRTTSLCVVCQIAGFSRPDRPHGDAPRYRWLRACLLNLADVSGGIVGDDGGMSALGHVWTAPWQELSDVSAALVGCGHVSGLLMRPM